MVAAYDAKQDGTWDPRTARRKRRKPCEDTPEKQEFVAAPDEAYRVSTDTDQIPNTADTSDQQNPDSGLKSASEEPPDTGAQGG